MSAMNRISYNEIIQAFQEFCTKHYQIAQFVDMQESDFQTLENKYPTVICVPAPSTIAQGLLSLQFVVVFADILIADNSNGRDVYSDMLEVAKDFVAYFTNNPDYSWSLDDNLTIEPFYEKYDDILAGWVLQASVSIPFGKGVCDIPMEEF